MIIEQPIYDGSLIHDRFAYRFFKKDTSPVGNIVAFVAPMIVTDNLIDLEDSLSNDYIYSDKALNFCWEIPNLDPFGAVAFQRWFNANVATIIGTALNIPISVEGDDLMVNQEFIGSDDKKRAQGKVSVSITYSANGCAIGHTGINILAGEKAPGFAYSTNMTEEYANAIMEAVIKMFNDEVADIALATAKIIV